VNELEAVGLIAAGRGFQCGEDPFKGLLNDGHQAWFGGAAADPQGAVWRGLEDRVGAKRAAGARFLAAQMVDSNGGPGSAFCWRIAAPTGSAGAGGGVLLKSARNALC